MMVLFFFVRLERISFKIMRRRYKRRKMRRLGPCPNNGVRCGNSTRCWPAGTKCKSRNEVDHDRKERKKAAENVKRGNAKIERSEKKLDFGTIIGVGAVTVGVVGLGIYYKSRQGVVVPQKYQEDRIQKTMGSEQRDPMSAADPGAIERYKGGYENIVGDSEFSGNNRKVNQRKAQFWAQEVLKDPDTVIIDLETTALFENVNPADPSSWKKYRSDTPGIFQIGIVDGNLDKGYDIKLNPERKITKAAQQVTGMTDDDISSMKSRATFKDYYPYLKQKLENKRVIAFNSRFDLQVIDALCYKNGLEPIKYKNRPYAGVNKKGNITMDPPVGNDADAMHWFALYKGKMPRPDFRAGEYNIDTGLAYTKLPTIPGGKAHDALTDVVSVYDVLRIMAEGRKPYGMKPSEQQLWEQLQ